MLDHRQLMMGSTEIPECLDSLDFLDCPGLPLILVWFTWTDQWGLVTSLSACHTVRPWSQRSGYVTWHLVSTNLRWPPAIISHSVWYINSWGVSMKCRNFFSHLFIFTIIMDTFHSFKHIGKRAVTMIWIVWCSVFSRMDSTQKYLYLIIEVW